MKKLILILAMMLVSGCSTPKNIRELSSTFSRFSTAFNVSFFEPKLYKSSKIEDLKGIGISKEALKAIEFPNLEFTYPIKEVKYKRHELMLILLTVHNATWSRFRSVGDKKLGVLESKSEMIYGDCVDYALLIQKRLAFLGVKSQVLLFTTDDFLVNHAALYVDGYVLDTQTRFIRVSQELKRQPFAVSDNDKDWRIITGLK